MKIIFILAWGRKVNCVMRCFSFKLIGRGSASAKGGHQHSRRAENYNNLNLSPNFIASCWAMVPQLASGIGGCNLYSVSTSYIQTLYFPNC